MYNIHIHISFTQSLSLFTEKLGEKIELSCY